MSQIDLNELLNDTFLQELVSIDYVDPGNEVEEKDTVIGEMNDLEKRLYALLAKYGRMKGHLKIKIRYDNMTSDERKTLIAAHLEMNIISEVLHSLMWALIRIRFGEEKSLGLRENFLIVSYEDKNKIRDILGSIIGQID